MADIKFEIPKSFRTYWTVKLAGHIMPVMSCNLDLSIDQPAQCIIIVPYADSIDDLKPLTPMSLHVRCYDKKDDTIKNIVLWEGFLYHVTEVEDPSGKLATMQFTDIIGITKYVQTILQSGRDPINSGKTEIVVPAEKYQELIDNSDNKTVKIIKSTQSQLSEISNDGYETTGGFVSYIKQMVIETINQLPSESIIKNMLQSFSPSDTLLFFSSLKDILTYVSNSQLLTTVLTPIMGQEDLWEFFCMFVQRLWDSHLVPIPLVNYNGYYKNHSYMMMPRTVIFDPNNIESGNTSDQKIWKKININKIIVNNISKNTPLVRPTRLVSVSPAGNTIWVPPFRMDDEIIPAEETIAKIDKYKNNSFMIAGPYTPTLYGVPGLNDSEITLGNTMIDKYTELRNGVPVYSTQELINKLINSRENVQIAALQKSIAYIEDIEKNNINLKTIDKVSVDENAFPKPKHIFSLTSEELDIGYIPKIEKNLFSLLNSPSLEVPVFNNLFGGNNEHTLDDHVMKSYMSIRFLELRSSEGTIAFDMPFDPWLFPGFPARFYRDANYEEIMPYTAKVVGIRHAFSPQEATSTAMCSDTLKITDDFLDTIQPDDGVYWDGVLGSVSNKILFLTQISNLTLSNSETIDIDSILTGRSKEIKTVVDNILKEYQDMGIDLPYVTGDF